jgi:N6-adenosine-specific RNA methylase IME4
VIYADPEGRFEPRSRLTGMDRAAHNHFSTSFLSVIKARPAEAIAAKDLRYLSVFDHPMFIAAHEVMADWGFEYKSHVVWAKPDMGTGYWFREKHEVLMIGTRGKVPAPAPGEQWPSVIRAPRGKRHSAKPERFAKMIEKLYPNTPKTELNRRGPARKGWDAWGAEAKG